MAPPLLALDGVVKRFGRVTVIHRFDLEIAKGEFVALMGPKRLRQDHALRLAGRAAERGRDPPLGPAHQ